MKFNNIKNSIFTLIMLISTSTFSNEKWVEHSGGIVNIGNFDYMTYMISSNGEHYCIDDKPIPANYKGFQWYGPKEELATDKKIKDDNLKPEMAYFGKVVFSKQDMGMPGLFDTIITPDINISSLSSHEDCDLIVSEKKALNMLESVVEKLRDFLDSKDTYLKLNIPGDKDYFDY